MCCTVGPGCMVQSGTRLSDAQWDQVVRCKVGSGYVLHSGIRL